MEKRISEIAWAPCITFLPGAHPYVDLNGIRRKRSDVISYVEDTYYSGTHDWRYCKRMGWRVFKIKITEPRP